ncbi:MAG: hypothetical protein NC218_05190 [Acetobacter sp.]|nr:hypothetical protein [Acetobacter sp.]
MFIEITTPNNPLKTAVFLTPYQQGTQAFTPEAAQQILSMSNHPKNIKDMLTLITALPKEEQVKYKDVILNTFDHREQPNDNILLGKKLAAAHGFEDELSSLLKQMKDYDFSHNEICYLTGTHEKAIICADETPNIENYPSNCSLIHTNNNTDYLWGADFTSIKNLRFKEGNKVCLANCANLPEDLDLSTRSFVDLSMADLTSVKNLKFKDNSQVFLSSCKNLPADLDVSMCDTVGLSNTDLAQIRNLNFKNCKNINLSNCKNLPADLDVSMCDTVNLSNTDLAQIRNLKFKNGAQVNLSHCKNLPENLDISMCDKVDLNHTHLSSIKNLSFKQGSHISLSVCDSLPKDLDVSMCDEIDLFNANLNQNQTIKFKNEEQKTKSKISDESIKIHKVKITYINQTPSLNYFHSKASSR